jgi:hypothetical protein
MVIARLNLPRNEVAAGVTAMKLVQRVAEFPVFDALCVKDIRPGVSRRQADRTPATDCAQLLLNLERMAGNR